MVAMKLKDCCKIVAGQSPESKYYNTEGVGIPFFQGKADFGDLYPTIRVYCSQPTKIAGKNDILLSVRAPVGATNLSPGKVCIGRGLTAIRPSAKLDLKYLLHFFRHFEAQLEAKGTGTTFKAITQDIVKNIDIPVPSLPEQKRIVAKIEELFSELDCGVKMLKTTKQQLAVYRQAVLKAAFKGIGKYVELGCLTERVFDGPFGTHLKTADYVGDGIRVVRLENIKNAMFDDSKKSFVTEEKYETIKQHTVFPSDLIMSTFISDSIKVCQLPSYVSFAVNKSDCVGIRLKRDISQKYILFYLSSRDAYERLIHKVHGATRPRVNTKQIKAIEIPFVAYNGQLSIVSAIESRLSVCDSIEKMVDTALQQAEALRQSILKRAFEGNF